MENKGKPTLEYLKKKLEEKINEPVIFSEVFTEKEMPSRWAIYNFNMSYLTEQEKYTVVIYIPKSDESFLCSTSLAVFDHEKDSYVFFTSCGDEG
ncbi:hypothetical protein SDC9_44886 [bioreactor metagenome]|jgi:hypothetical protein|uniref:Uncharacterized protein n=1 Tax=bioreactor metagenome TaxID=1076179 RepID=A0A644W4K4_9ZZZZ